jgi:hypothetical protein
MLLRRGRLAKPTVIRNINQQIRAMRGKFTNLTWINGLITNIHAKLIPV